MALLTDNLISYYQLEANGNDLLGVNNMSESNTSYVAGKILKGCSFNGSTSTMRNSTISLATGASPYSINFWVKLNAEIGGGTCTLSFLGPDAAKEDTQYSIDYEYNGGSRRLSVAHYYNGPETYWPVPGSATLGTTWNMVTATYSGSIIRLYLNGTEIANGGGTGTYGFSVTPSYPKGLTIGSNYTGSYGAKSNAIIDEYGIWSRVLTPAEITKLYNGSNGLTYPFIAGSFLPFFP